MIDFLRANTWCSQHEYKWQMTVPQVRLASLDFTHIEYLSDDEKALRKNGTTVIGDGGDLKNLNDLGIPIIQ